MLSRWKTAFILLDGLCQSHEDYPGHAENHWQLEAGTYSSLSVIRRVSDSSRPLTTFGFQQYSSVWHISQTKPRRLRPLQRSDTYSHKLTMDWRQFTWSMTVMQFLLSPSNDISGLLTPGHYSCQGRRQHWGWGVIEVAGPHIWNSLPAALRTATLSPLVFARHLKTDLFDWDWQRVRGLFRTRSTNLRIIIVVICSTGGKINTKHDLNAGNIKVPDVNWETSDHKTKAWVVESDPWDAILISVILRTVSEMVGTFW